MVLPTLENTLPALEPIKRTVPTTMTRMTASIMEYSAMSCPSWFAQSLLRTQFIVLALNQAAPDTAVERTKLIPQGSFSCEKA